MAQNCTQPDMATAMRMLAINLAQYAVAPTPVVQQQQQKQTRAKGDAALCSPEEMLSFHAK
jgi:hypothetical protein